MKFNLKQSFFQVSFIFQSLVRNFWLLSTNIFDTHMVLSDTHLPEILLLRCFNTETLCFQLSLSIKKITVVLQKIQRSIFVNAESKRKRREHRRCSFCGRNSAVN